MTATKGSAPGTFHQALETIFASEDGFVLICTPEVC
jgi:hypothetical protein